MGYIIKVTRGRDAGKSFPLEGKGITLGRKPGNSLILEDIKISGVHGELIFDKGRVVYRDLGSTNGTFFRGEKIEERILAPGDSLVLGQTEITLMEEKSGSGPGSLVGNRLDEVRVIRDVRGTRRGLGGLILLLVLVLGAGSAGTYYFLNLTPEQSFVTLEARKDNLLAKGWSFEEDPKSPDFSVLWNLKGGGGALYEAYFLHQRQDPHSGLYSIQADLAEGGAARGAYAQAIPVNQRRQYRASAWVRVSGSALVSLKAVFSRTDAPGQTPQVLYTDEFVASREIGVDYHRIEGTVFPPPEAESMIFEIVAAGRGEVVVDDVELIEEPSATPTQLGTSGVIDFFSCGSGFLVRRIGRTLFLGGRIQALESKGEEGPVIHHTDRSGYQPDGERMLYCGPSVGWIRTSRNLEVNAQKVEGFFSLPALDASALSEIRYTFDLLGDYGVHGIGLLSEGEYSLFSGSFPATPAEALILGGANDRIMIRFERSIPVAGMERKQGGLSVACLFDPGPAMQFKFSIQSDFSEEARTAQAMVNEATRAEEQSRPGEALAILDRVLKDFSYNESVIERAETLHRRIQAEKQALLGDILERLKSAQFLNIPAEFLTLEDLCRRGLERFPGDSDLQATLDEVMEKGRVLLEDLNQQEAARYFRLALNLYQAGGREITLAEIQRYLKENYPGTEWTAMAQALEKPPGTGSAPEPDGETDSGSSTPEPQNREAPDKQTGGSS